MSFWRRAALYLSRNKGRTIIIGILIFAMSCFVLIGFSLTQSTEVEIDSLRQSLGTGFILEADVDNETFYKVVDAGYSARVYSGPRISDKMIEQILDVEGVTDYNIDSLTHLVWTGLKLRPGMWADSEPSKVVSAEELKVVRQTTQVYPVLTGDLQTNFRTGALTISEGRNIQAKDHFKAVISEQRAEESGLSIGDTFTVETKEGNFQPSDTPAKTWGKPVELEIVGLFHMNFTQAASTYTAENQYIENLIYADMNTHKALEQNLSAENIEEQGYLKVTFFVEDPLKLDDIMQQAGDLESVDADGLLLSVDDTAYQAAIKPYGQIGTFAAILLIVGIVGVGLILYLLMRLWVQARMQEVGILLSLGIGKRKMIGQMLAESLMVCAAALTVSFLLSGTLINQCTHFAERITAPRSGTEAFNTELNYFGEAIVTQTSAEKVELEHGASSEAILFMAVLVCGVSSSSVFLASIKITDIEPKKLLRSM